MCRCKEDAMAQNNHRDTQKQLLLIILLILPTNKFYFIETLPKLALTVNTKKHIIISIESLDDNG